MLDKHYGIMMTFNALSKELYSLKQGSTENMAEFRVHLSQQVQIPQVEYPGRIQQKHMEEMKQDHFYDGLNPKYQLPEDHHNWRIKCYPATGIGNLFPSRKLKGNSTFMAQSTIVWSIETEGDLSVKLEGEKESESSEGDDQETPNEIGGASQPISYIVHFANAVELYQKKNQNYFRWQSWPSCERLSKWSQQGQLKSEFKCRRGDDNKERLDLSETSSHSTGISRWGP